MTKEADHTLKRASEKVKKPTVKQLETIVLMLKGRLQSRTNE